MGAGFASGREIYSFFSRWGEWSWALIGLCGLWMGLLVWAWLLLIHQNRLNPFEGIGRIMFALLMVVTAGSMTAAAGEIISLWWPWLHGLQWGTAITLGGAVWLSRKGLTALKGVSWLLLPGILLLFWTTGRAPTWEGKAANTAASSSMGWNCLAYGSMNVTLAMPVLKEVCLNRKNRCLLAAVLGGLLVGLLSWGNGVLLKHPHLADEALPLIQLLRTQGRLGFSLGVSVLYLAVFTTLLTGLRGMHQVLPKRWSGTCRWGLICLVTLWVAAAGFERLIEKAYPLLGGLCMGWMAFTALKCIARSASAKVAQNSERTEKCVPSSAVTPP